MAAPNFWYTDVATNQIQGANFPGTPGVGTLTTQPGSQNTPQIEGVPQVHATYFWTGNEAVGDIINICKLEPGVLVNPDGHVSSGFTAPATTLTIAIGDNDLGYPATALPIPNPGALLSQGNTGIQGGGPVSAPLWVSGMNFAPGNLVYDGNSTPSNQVYMAMAAISNSATAPHSAAANVFLPISQRYSNSIDIHAANGNVAFAAGTQLYGGPASCLPTSIVANSVPANFTASQLLNQPYIIQQDCWAQAVILTLNTVSNAAFSIFRFQTVPLN